MPLPILTPGALDHRHRCNAMVRTVQAAAGNQIVGVFLLRSWNKLNRASLNGELVRSMNVRVQL